MLSAQFFCKPKPALIKLWLGERERDCASGADKALDPELGFWLSRGGAVGLGASHLISLGLNFTICKMELIPPTSSGCEED